MTKTFPSICIILGLHSAARAQGSDVSLGLKVGGSLTDVVGTDAPTYEKLFGFHGGIFANIGIADMVAFQPELLYSQKGARQLRATTNPMERDAIERLDYLDVPLALHVNAKGLFFEAGPQVGFLLAAKSKSGNASSDVKYLYNTFDFGYLAGLGYQRKEGLGIGLRYNGGFTKVEKPIELGPALTVQNEARNSAFQLYLTYSINGR